MTVSVSMTANDRAQVSQARVQDGLCLSESVVYYCECGELRVLKHFVDVHNYFVFVFCTFSSVCCICVCIVLSISGG